MLPETSFVSQLDRGLQRSNRAQTLLHGPATLVRCSRNMKQARYFAVFIVDEGKLWNHG